MVFPYSLPLAAVSLLAISASALITYRHPERRVIAGAILVLGSSVWLMMQALELTSASLSVKFLYYSLRYVGVVTVPGAWLVLAMLISGYERHVNKRNILALTVIPLLSLLLIFTNESHNLMFSNVSLDLKDPSLPLVVSFGPAYWVLAVVYSYTLMVAGFVMIARRVIAARRSWHVLGVQILLVSMLPWALNVAYVLDPSLFMNFEPSSLAISVTGAVLLWRIVDLPILGVLPVAHEVLVDSMNEAIFVLDGQNRIVDANPKAQKLLGSSLSQTLGASIEKTWAEWPIIDRALGSAAEAEKEVTLGDESDRRVYELQSSAIEGLIGNASYQLVTLRDITERKRIEEALANERNVLRTLIDSLPDNIFIKDAESRFMISNLAHVHHLRAKTLDEIVGKTDFDIYPRELAASYFADERAVIQSGQPLVNREERTIDPEGKTRWLLTTKVPLRDDDDNVVGIVGVNRDITERKRLENEVRRYSEHLEKMVDERTRKLEESESRLRLITDSLPALISYLDAELRYAFANKAYEEWFGKPASEIIGRHIRDVLGEQTYQRTVSHLDAALSGKIQSYDYELPHRSRGTRYVTATYVPEFGADGQVRGIFVLGTDVTDRKRAEVALRESEQKYRELFEASPVSLWEEDFSEVKRYFDDLRSRGVNDLGRYLVEHPDEVAKCARMVKILDINEATVALYSAKSAEELKGELHRVLIHEAYDKFREELVALGEGKIRYESEFDNQTLTGDIKHVSLILNVVPGHEKTLGKVLVSIVDLTERKKMEQRLQQSERLAAIGQLAAMVGHDLRNPLQAVTSALYLAKKMIESPEVPEAEDRREAVGLLDGLDEQVNYMDKIISDLQNYSSPLAVQPVEMNLTKLVKEVLSHLSVPENVETTVVADDASTVIADPVLMRRVIVNLVNNAIQAMPDGGRVTITYNRRPNIFSFAVQDTGLGIAPEDLENIFTPFFTKKAKGQGLGLAVCKRLVEAQGGTINVKTNLGHGSTFTVTIPIGRKLEGT